MSKLKELESRLRDEPTNLGLKVSVAGAMRMAGRMADAVELYRAVAIAYRDQGRTHQAIAVCRSILEIVPDDTRCHALLGSLVAHREGRATRDTAQLVNHDDAQDVPDDVDDAGVTLTPPAAPSRPSLVEDTPLPQPMPYHVHDPTTSLQDKLSESDLPSAEGVDTKPGGEPTRPQVTGIANAARRISASLVGAAGGASGTYDTEDLAAELDTRQVPRIDSGEMEKISLPPPTVPTERVEFDDDTPTPPSPRDVAPAEVDEEQTLPRDLPLGTRPKTTTHITLSSPFFAPLPTERRASVLNRFQKKTVAAGLIVIRQGETNHPLLIVTRGRLDVRVERANGTLFQVGTIAIGEFVGEAALLARAPAAAHVIAATEVELLVLPPRDFYEIAGAYPALWAELKDVAERRNREHDQRTRGP